jgi:hypothetical protein
MDSSRRTALVAGALFIITFVTSIPAAFLLYPPVLNDANYIVGAGADAGVALGALLEVLLIIANVGTAVVLLPILKRQSEARTGHRRHCRPKRALSLHTRVRMVCAAPRSIGSTHGRVHFGGGSGLNFRPSSAYISGCRTPNRRVYSAPRPQTLADLGGSSRASSERPRTHIPPRSVSAHGHVSSSVWVGRYN